MVNPCEGATLREAIDSVIAQVQEGQSMATCLFTIPDRAEITCIAINDGRGLIRAETKMKRLETL